MIGYFSTCQECYSGLIRIFNLVLDLKIGVIAANNVPGREMACLGVDHLDDLVDVNAVALSVDSEFEERCERVQHFPQALSELDIVGLETASAVGNFEAVHIGTKHRMLLKDSSSENKNKFKKFYPFINIKLIPWVGGSMQYCIVDIEHKDEFLVTY
jgi:hypothetical protein